MSKIVIELPDNVIGVYVSPTVEQHFRSGNVGVFTKGKHWINARRSPETYAEYWNGKWRVRSITDSYSEDEINDQPTIAVNEDDAHER